MVDLEELYGEALAEIPNEPDGFLTLDSSLLSSPPDEVACARLKVVPWNLGRDYGDSARCDVIHFFADKTTYRRLGLLLFASLFHGNRPVKLYPAHPRNEIRAIRFGSVSEEGFFARGLQMSPVSYGYAASPPEHAHPLWKEEWRIEGLKKLGRNPEYFPYFDLTDERGRCGGAPEHFAARNYVDGFGDPQGTATLAALLLDIGMPQTELTEFCLESPSGKWSVAIGSAEARFWIGYNYT